MPNKSKTNVFDAIKLDYTTVKIIVITAFAVLAIIATPLFFILKNFVTFDALDRYLNITDSVRPKILYKISEVLESGYSRSFVFDSERAVDNAMLFYAVASEKPTVTLSMSAEPIAGTFPKSTVVYLNNCIVQTKTGPFNLYETDLSDWLLKCVPDQKNLHTLKITLPDGLPTGATAQLKCLILVSQRVREHIEEVSKK